MKKLIFLIIMIVALGSCNKDNLVHSFEKGEYTGTEFADCYSCHYEDYRNTYIGIYEYYYEGVLYADTINASHIELGMSTDCKNCHNTYSWN